MFSWFNSKKKDAALVSKSMFWCDDTTYQIIEKIINLIDKNSKFDVEYNAKLCVTSETYEYFKKHTGIEKTSTPECTKWFCRNNKSKIGIAFINNPYRVAETFDNVVSVNNMDCIMCVFYNDTYIPLEKADAIKFWKLKVDISLRNEISKMDNDFILVDKNDFETFMQEYKNKKGEE